MRHLVFITTIALLFTAPYIFNTAYAEEEVDPTLKKLSDHINAQWGWLIIIGILCFIPGFLVPRLPFVGVIVFVAIVLNALFLSPITH